MNASAENVTAFTQPRIDFVLAERTPASYDPVGPKLLLLPPSPLPSISPIIPPASESSVAKAAKTYIYSHKNICRSSQQKTIQHHRQLQYRCF